MRTILDEGRTWFLEALVYTDELRVVLVEGFRGDQREEVVVADHVLAEGYPVKPSDKSRKFAVRFSGCAAWQVVDESYTVFDSNEERDDNGFLQVLSRSAYFDYVTSHHGWFADTVGPAKHYRLWTEDEVIDVVAHDPPVVEPWPGT